MKRILIILIILLPFGIKAQVNQKSLFETNNIPINISYYGNLIIHPGIKIGADWNLLMINKTKEKKRKTKNITKVLFVSPSIAFYTHSNSNKGLFTSTDIGIRRYGKNLFYREFDIGLGYFHKWNSGETWEVEQNGNIKMTGTSGRGYFTPSLSLAFGKTFLRDEKEPVSVFIKINDNKISFYNAGHVPELSFELGIKISPYSGIKNNKLKTINKTKKRKHKKQTKN